MISPISYTIIIYKQNKQNKHMISPVYHLYNIKKFIQWKKKFPNLYWLENYTNNYVDPSYPSFLELVFY